MNELLNTSPEYIALVNIIYPIGHIYKSTKYINPSSFIDGTEWDLIEEGRFLYNFNDQINNNDRLGGESVAELLNIPVHSHSGDLYNRSHYSSANDVDFNEASSSSPGDGGELATTSYGNGSKPTHNNMPPYIAIYMWRRSS